MKKTWLKLGAFGAWLIFVFCVSFLVVFLMSSCSYKKATIKRTEDGVEFKMSRTGMLSYKDKEFSAEMDTRKPSMVEDIIKLWTIQTINKEK